MVDKKQAAVPQGVATDFEAIRETYGHDVKCPCYRCRALSRIRYEQQKRREAEERAKISIEERDEAWEIVSAHRDTEANMLKRLAELEAEIARMRPIVGAAYEWAVCESGAIRKTLVGAVRAYREAKKG